MLKFLFYLILDLIIKVLINRGDNSVSGLGIKEYLPPFVGVELEPNDIITGVSLASSGSGYDTLTDSISVLSLCLFHFAFYT